MSDPSQGPLLRRIETRAVMTNGKIVTAWYSYPMGTPYSTRQEIEQGLERAYGKPNFKIVDTFMPA